MRGIFILLSFCLINILSAQTIRDSDILQFTRFLKQNPILLSLDSTDMMINSSGFTFSQGEYKTFYKEQVSRTYDVNFYGKTLLANNRTTVFGKLSTKFSFMSNLSYLHSHDMDWMSTPYQVLSNTSRNWKKYLYNLQGGFIYNLGYGLYSCINFEYSPYKDYRIRDPRTQITGLDLSISPSFSYNISTYERIYFQYTYSKHKKENLTNYKEEIREGVFRLFLLGNGYYNTLVENLYLYNGDSHAVSVNYSFSKNKFNLYSNISFSRSKNYAKINIDYMKREPVLGLYRKNMFDISLHTDITSEEGLMMNNLIFRYEKANAYTFGRTNQKNYFSQIMGLDYDFMYEWISKSWVIDMNLQFVEKKKIDKQSVHEFSFSDVYMHSRLSKTISFSSFDLLLAMGFSLKRNIQSTLKVSDMEKDNFINRTIIAYDNEYYSSSYISPEFKFGFITKLYDKLSKIEFSVSEDRIINKKQELVYLNNNGKRLFLSGRLIINL